MSRKRKLILDSMPRGFNEGPFFGNGTMGAMLYCEDGDLRMAVDHVALWEMRMSCKDEPKAPFSEILKHKQEYLGHDPRYVGENGIWDFSATKPDPTRLPALTLKLRLPAALSAFHAEMDLNRARAALRLTLENGAVLCGEMYVDSCVNALRIRLDGPGAQYIVAAPEGWDTELPALAFLKRWGYRPGDVRNAEGCIHLLQGFSADGLAVLSAATDARSDTLDSFTLTATLDAVNASDAAEGERMMRANAELIARYAAGADEFVRAHEDEWANFWRGCDITVPSARLQDAFDQEMYKVFCNARPDSWPVTLEGVWNSDKRMPPWTGDLHNDLNVDACYWPIFFTGNVALARPYIDFYSRAVPRFEERAEKLFGVRGAIHVPTTMAPNGYSSGSEWGIWNTLLGPELYVAMDFCWFYEYSRDEAVLREKVMPFLKGTARLYEGIAIEKADGRLHIPFTSSPEVPEKDTGRHMMRDDSTFVISILHYILKKICAYGDMLGEDTAHWREFERRLVPVAVGEKGYPLFPGEDVFCSHRHFCHAFPIFPLGCDSHSAAANATLDAIINQGMTGYAGWSFPYLAILAAHCDRGNMARTMLELYCMAFRSANSFTVNGDPYRNGLFAISDKNAGESSDAFTLEAGFMVPAALCQMMAHRSGDALYLLAGVPDEWEEFAFDGVAVEGGHRVSARVQGRALVGASVLAGSTESVRIVFARGGAPVGFCQDGEKLDVRRDVDGAFTVELTAGRKVDMVF